MKEEIYVLIVEDEYISAKYLQKIVESINNFRVCKIVDSVEKAILYLKNHRVNIVLIDIVLNDNSEGSNLAFYIKKYYPSILSIFLTAYSNKDYIKDAVNAKVFAYLLKPYRPDEIIATLLLAKDKILERDKKNQTLKLVDGYYFDFGYKRIYKHGKEVPLAPLELLLIQTLAKNSNIILEKEALLDILNISSDALRALIYRLRRTLSPNIIKSYRRLGYKIGVE